MYRFLGQQLLHQEAREFVFARCFMHLCWNLMSRAAMHLTSVLSIWHGQRIHCVFSCHMKNDQTGEQPRDPRHIYANPLMPEIYPILCLGMYWMCYQFEERDNQQFPGTNQYDRFRKLLSRCVKLGEIAEELERARSIQMILARTLCEKGPQRIAHRVLRLVHHPLQYI
jgi:hypothetical protein